MENQHINRNGKTYTEKNGVIKVGYVNNGCHNSAQKERIALNLSETLENSILRCIKRKNGCRKVDTNFVILALTSKSTYPPKYTFSQVRSHIRKAIPTILYVVKPLCNKLCIQGCSE